MPDFTGGYTSAVNDQSQRRYRDVEMLRLMEQVTENRQKFQQEQLDRANVIDVYAKQLDQSSQLSAPPTSDQGAQTPPPGAPSLPMMPPGQQPGPANVQTAAAPAPMPPMPTPMPSGTPSIPPGMFPPGTMTGTAPNPQAALERMRAMDKAGQPGAVMAPGPNWQMSPAAPPGLGGQPPAAPPAASPDGGIAPPPLAAPQQPSGIEPIKMMDPMKIGRDLITKYGMTPGEAAEKLVSILPMIESNNRMAISDFKANAEIAQKTLDFRERLMRDEETRRHNRDREARLEAQGKERLAQGQERNDIARERAGRSGGAGGAPSGLTPEGIDLAAQQYLRDGKMPALGFDAASKRAILDRAGEIQKQSGGDASSVPGARAEFHADSTALTAINKDLTSIKPFAEMLDKNAGILKDLATKVLKTDSRLANKPLNWLGQNVTGDADVAEYLAQMRFVQTEAARVLNNPRLVGQLTDTARKEMEGVVDGTLSLDQTNRVIDRILQDSRNRVGAMEKQRDALAKSLRGGSATSVPTTGKVVDWADLK